DIRHLAHDHGQHAKRQAFEKRDLKQAECPIHHLADGLRTIGRVQNRRHTSIIRGVDAEHTIASALIAATRHLAMAEGADNPRLDAEVLLAHTLGLGRAMLRAQEELRLFPAQWQSFAELLDRRARGEPIAYLTGQREFWSLTLKVSPTVLVP